MTSPLVAAAGDYLTRGLSVIALTGKTPNVRVHRHGLDEPLVGAPESDEDWALIRDVFEHAETTGIGIVIPYPYVVVDIDGEEGAIQWAELINGLHFGSEEPVPRWVAKTGRGLHLWFACATPTGSIKLGSKLDLKGQNSYVAVPPSRHPDGHTYEWLLPPGDDAPLEAPALLVALIEDHAFDVAGRIAAKETRRLAWGPRFEEGDHTFYAQASHDALIKGMETAVEGNRNNYLHWSAATLVEEGGSDDEFNALAETALARGLTAEEVRRTIRSARRA